jgi:mannose-6-phosphate isomerase-like protein (cupin superfamily)
VIVTETTGAGRAASHTKEEVQWTCLARRGMLFSECEAVDYLELAPRAAVTMRGRCGTEEVWYVLAGHADFADLAAELPQRIGPGDLALRSAGTSATVRNPSSDRPARLLLIAVLPPAVTDRLPRRRPSIDRGLR